MKEVKTVQDVEIIVKKILENKEAEKKDVEERIKENDQNLIEAYKEKDKAESEGNEEYYLKIREKITELDNLKDMYESRLEKINEKELINTKDYNDLVQAVYNYFDKKEKETRLKLKNLYESAENEGKKLNDVAEQCNNILKTLQEDLYKNNDRRILENGKMLFIESETKNIKNFETIFWSKKGVESSQYKDFFRGE